MAAKPEIPIPKPHRVFTLGGKPLTCYRAGMELGKAEAYNDAASNLARLHSHHLQQLTELRKRILEDPTFPLATDHPMFATVDALPALAEVVRTSALQFTQEASRVQASGSRYMAEVAASDEMEEARWRPPWRAFWMLLLVVLICTLVSTSLAIYATRLSW